MVTQLTERKTPDYRPINLDAAALRDRETAPKVARGVLQYLRLALLAALWLLGAVLLMGAVIFFVPKPASDSGDGVPGSEYPRYWGPYRP
jgi:hypothetical protein